MAKTVEDKIARGMKEQAAYALILRLGNEGMDPDVAGMFIKGVSEGKVDEVMETLSQTAFKFIKPKKKT